MTKASFHSSSTKDPFVVSANSLVGRNEDLKALIHLLSQGHHVAVSAPAGSGKTALAYELLAQCRAQRFSAVMVPTGQIARLADFVAILLTQIEDLADDSESRKMLGYLQAALADDQSTDQQSQSVERDLLTGSLELLALIGARSDSRALLIIDDFDHFYAAPRSSDAAELFARLLRVCLQRVNGMSVLFTLRSADLTRRVFEDRNGALFGFASHYSLSPPSASSWFHWLREKFATEGVFASDDALAYLVDVSSGSPLYVHLIAQAVIRSASKSNAAEIGVGDVEAAFHAAINEQGLALAERLDAVRRSSTRGLQIAQRLAFGESPYAGVRTPNEVTRVLSSLDRLGLAFQPRPRVWALSDPFLAQMLRRLTASTRPSEQDEHSSDTDADFAAEWMLRSKPTRRDTRWGLRATLCRPTSTFISPHYGEIALTALEAGILDTAEFQRRRRVKQLGMAHIAYPAAAHTSFEHSLGTLRAISQLCAHVVTQHTRTEPAPDLFDAWERDESDNLDRHIPKISMLVRLAALVHDLGNPLFADVFPSGWYPDESQQRDARLKRRWHAIVDEMSDRLQLRDQEYVSLTSGPLFDELMALTYSHRPAATKYGFLRELVQGPLARDLFDYLARDHLATGLPAAPARHIARAVFLTEERPDASQLAVNRAGTRKQNVDAEIVRHVELRSQFLERVMSNKVKLAADALIREAIMGWIESLTKLLRPDMGETWEVTAEARLERHGEDGFLEYLAALGEDSFIARYAGATEWAAKTTEHMAQRVLTRTLPRRIATAECDGGTVSTWQDARRIREISRQAAYAGGLSHDAAFVLHVPPTMNLGLLDTISFDGKRLAPIVEHSDATGQMLREVRDQQQKRLAVSVFADADTDGEQLAAAISWLEAYMDLRFRRE